MFKKYSIFAFIIFMVASCQPKPQKTENRGTLANNGMVSSTHPLASQVGVEIMRKGGNAADATVATFFALAVVYPVAGNIGGSAFVVYRLKDGQVGSIDGREKAPAKASRDMFLDKEGNVIKDLSLIGHLASGVPGSVDAMYEMHKKFGKLAWKDVIQPAINLANDGFLLTKREAEYLNRTKDLFLKINKHKIHVVREDRAWQEGDTIYYKELARVLERIRDSGRDGFYKGETADLIAKEMEKGKGLISKEDLANYKAVWRTPVVTKYKDCKVISMPPPSSGGIALLQLMQGAEKYPFKKWGLLGSQTIHTMTELERRVYADRATHLGDPDFYKVPQEMLLNPAYNKKRNASIKPTEKTPSVAIKEGNVTSIESVETTHFSVADKEGNAFSITTTLNSYFGSKVMVEGGGFFLNNEMDDFSVKPGVPNQFGAIGGEANAIAPNKRMLSSMTPTIVEKNGKLLMVVGSPGGTTIITTVYQVILNVLEYKMTMQEAVNAKRFHHQWQPDVILVENGAITDSVKARLQSMGHIIQEIGGLGKVDAILRLPDGTYEGASDLNRSDGAALGY
jgi:gamma-glutamyltranspeptidase / glutathione hydrolase